MQARQRRRKRKGDEERGGWVVAAKHQLARLQDGRKEVVIGINVAESEQIKQAW